MSTAPEGDGARPRGASQASASQKKPTPLPPTQLCFTIPANAGPTRSPPKLGVVRKSPPAGLRVRASSMNTSAQKRKGAADSDASVLERSVLERSANSAAQGPTYYGNSVTPLKVSEVRPRKKYVVGTMKHCGSIYEELTRQLVETGVWTQLPVKQKAATKTLFVPSLLKELTEVDVHLFLGQKIPTEHMLAQRRSAITKKQTSKMQRRVPMGVSTDNLPRVADFIEGTRCITLKGTMVTTLLEHHGQNWESLGEYLPMTFQLCPGRPSKDDREALLATCNKPRSRSQQGHSSVAEPRSPYSLWIVKSSSGAHGDNIEIFAGDKKGVNDLLDFVDNQKGSVWVAQQYIDRPLLYHKRKFDIRCWVLVLRESFEIFVHEELVMRMSSVPYSRNNATNPKSRLAHITNHCIQTESDAYSKYEEGNELWREHLDGLIRYKARQHRSRSTSPSRQSPCKRPGTGSAAGSRAVSPQRPSPSVNSPYPSVQNGSLLGSSMGPQGGSGQSGTGATLRNTISPQIHGIVVDTLLASKSHIPVDAKPPPTYCFQVLGYDFLIDEDLKVWLLEINGAPGGAERLLPRIMGDTIELAIAPHFPQTANGLHREMPNGYVKVYPRK